MTGFRSGLRGTTLTGYGHHWIGCDISKPMLGEEFVMFLALMNMFQYVGR